MSRRVVPGTEFLISQPPTPDPSQFAPYLHANPNGYSAAAFDVIRAANIAVCLLTALALISGGPSPPLKR